MGVFAKLGMGAATPVTEAYEFITDRLVCKQTITDLSGIRGTRGHPKERTRETRRDVSGQIVLNPTAVELSRLLPRILGKAAVGNVFGLAELLPEFFVTSDRGPKVFTYNGCQVNKATFKAAVGAGPLELTLDIIGKDETPGAAGSFPAALVLDETAAPFVLSDLVLTVGAVPYQCDGFELVVDNMLETRFANSLIAKQITPSDRVVTSTFRVPYGDSDTIYATGSAGVAATAAFTSAQAAVSCLFTLPALTFGKETPEVDARTEEWLPITARGYKDGATDELQITLDFVP
jgi:hypothetical protein